MKRTITVVLVVLVPLLAGCRLVSVTGSGNVVTQEEAITGFDKVEISQGFRVDISQGDTFSVVIQVDDNLVQHLRVVKQDSTLKIGLEPNRNYVNATLQAEVTMPELTRLTLRDGSHATVSGSGGDLTLSVTGGSGADLANFSVENADVTASGGSQVTVNVSGRLDANATGGSKVYYRGNPTLGTIEESGGSEVRPR